MVKYQIIYKIKTYEALDEFAGKKKMQEKKKQ